jgi:hypothetical protein
MAHRLSIEEAKKINPMATEKSVERLDDIATTMGHIFFPQQHHPDMDAAELALYFAKSRGHMGELPSPSLLTNLIAYYKTARSARDLYDKERAGE